jgi:Family of unknown function (DUF6292)
MAGALADPAAPGTIGGFPERIGRPMSREDVGGFARARAKAHSTAEYMRGRASRTVADHAVDSDDLHQLLSMLGLDDKAGESVALGSGLAGYVRAVAAAVRVPMYGTGFEISDTATAYVGLRERWSRCPGRDLMLVWGERHGWYVALETEPIEAPVVLAYLGGTDLTPPPEVVAQFVVDVLAGRLMLSIRPVFPVDEHRGELAKRLSRYGSAS